jgi:hypothetical protein
MADAYQVQAPQGQVPIAATMVPELTYLRFFASIMRAIGQLQGGTRSPQDASAVATGASPFTYVAASAGSLHIAGGTVSAVALIRGAASYAITPATGQIIPISAGDSVKVTYTAAPTLNFLPR